MKCQRKIHLFFIFLPDVYIVQGIQLMDIHEKRGVKRMNILLRINKYMSK